MLGIGERSLFRLTAEGRIPCLRLGPGKTATKLYRITDLEAFLASLAAEGQR